LVDLSAENIALARILIGLAGYATEDLIVADARDLSVLDGRYFDAILALGPLYHLTCRMDRVSFLSRRARSVLKAGGILIACYLNAWGIARTLLSDLPEWFSDSVRLQALRTGGDFSGAEACSGFTECSWSTPALARAELEEAGFMCIDEIGVEGFAAGCRKEVEQIAASQRGWFAHVVQFGVETSRLPQYRYATDHLVFVAKIACGDGK